MFSQDVFTKHGACWIWHGGPLQVNQYVEFRHEFVLDELSDEELRLFISIDSNYAVWINGAFIDCGQYHDYPTNKVFDVLQVSAFLKQGRNSLCVLGYCQGDSSFQYIKGEAGLLYVLQTPGVAITSGEQTYCRVSPSYTSGPAHKITPQLSYGFEYNAIMDDGWIAKEYAMDQLSWEPATVKTDYTTSLSERPIKKLLIKERSNARLVSQGIFFRVPDDSKSVAELMQMDFLSFRLCDEVFDEPNVSDLPSVSGVSVKPTDMEYATGTYLVLDLGQEEAGFLNIEVDAEEGAIMDIAYGEHLEDLRVRAAVGGRHFAVRYTCSAGRQDFTHYFKRLGGRYIQIHISGVKERFVLYYAGIVASEFPLMQDGSFCSPDSLHNRIFEVAVRTLHLCMHEHYEDTPWREQALYGMDSRNQALCGYYCFGEYDFPEASFALLGDGLKDDGYLEICAPAEFSITIPSFSLAWIIEVAEHFLYSGNPRLSRTVMTKIRTMLDIYLSNSIDGLMASPQGDRYWHFYEWASGLDGESDGFGRLNTQRFDAPLNLLLCVALDSASYIAKYACQDSDLAKCYDVYAAHIRKVFHSNFWDAGEQVYRTYVGDGCKAHYAELTQALALYAKACPEHVASGLRERLAMQDSGLVKNTLSHSLFRYEALLQDPSRYAEFVFEDIGSKWGYMLYSGATSFWETILGASDFADAGSLCHGWSAIPVYLYQAYMLGVKPTKPGFETFTVNPITNVFDRVDGKVPTPHGIISVSWSKIRDDVKCSVSCHDALIYDVDACS